MNAELRRHATQAVADYKRLRQVIEGADVYHLTPPPARDHPTGRMGLEYVSANGQRALFMAYRLGQSAAENTFRLRGLDPEHEYAVKLDGKAHGRRTGRQLAEAGCPVTLDAEWWATIIEIEAVSGQ